MLLEQILKELKTKYKDLGLGDDYLKVIAKRLARTVKEESEISDAVADLEDEMKFQQSQNDTLRTLAQVVAVCITGNKIYQYFIKKSVLKHYEPKDILEFSQTLLNTSDYGNFLLSIALMNGNRPTKANPIEKK